MRILPVVFLILALTAVLFFFACYVMVLRKNNPGADYIDRESAGLFRPGRRYPMTRKDVLPLAIIMVLYSAAAFFNLGDTRNPTTFCSFQESGQYVEIEVPEGTLVTGVRYYTGLHTGNYFLQFSEDGVNYTDEAVMEQNYAQLFKWLDATLNEVGKSARYIRIISDARLDMGELCVYDWAGDSIPVSSIKFDSGAAVLFDEQNTVPDAPSYLNSAYFDEIYHVRTAQEHLTGVYPYEITHPPLGKVIIGLGIQAFGLNPFGWRFMGVLFGILMLPALYLLIKNMFGSTAISACGTLIFAFDFMHYTQTRIATIDTYGVFFILLMFLFMYRYITADRDDPFSPKKGTVDLFLCGLFFGIGAASKWIVIYGGIGLAIMWLIFRIIRGIELIKTGRSREHTRELVTNILQCLLFFVVIPAIVYYLSYFRYGEARGMSGISMFTSRDYFNIVMDNQKYMFNYHAGVDATHPYSASWYQWLVDGRPILYYMRSLPENMKSAFACFMNPLVCWGGLLAIFAMIWRVIRHRDSKAMFILIGYLSSLVPWMLISRITFAYHYFPCLIFLVLAICHMFNSFRLRDRFWKRKVYIATGACLLLFVAFYPVLSGLAAPRWYSDLLAWIPGAWPF